MKNFLALTTVAILFAMPSCSENIADIEKAKKLAIAIMPDTPHVDIIGQVFMPDGSPADWCYVAVFSAGFKFSQSVSSMGGKSISMDDYCTYTSGATHNIKREDGTFQVTALPGGNIVITVYPVLTDEKVVVNPNKRLVAKPVVIVPQENMEPLKITLEEGIPLRGKMVSDDGSHVTDRGFHIDQQVEPILGADISDMKKMFRASRWCPVNENGEYEIYLLPGKYTIRDRNETITIVAMDTEKRLDLTVSKTRRGSNASTTVCCPK